jgi:hypothetical protein
MATEMVMIVTMANDEVQKKKLRCNFCQLAGCGRIFSEGTPANKKVLGQ